MNKLKPCPFCDGDAEIVKTPLWRGNHGYQDCYDISVACRNDDCLCHPHTPGFNTVYSKEPIAEYEAISAWNKREVPHD